MTNLREASARLNDLPELRERLWHRSSSGNRSLIGAKAEASFLRESGEVVKIVKEIRWRVFWKRKNV